MQQQGWHEYTIQARIDRYLSWHKELIKKHEAGQQDLSSELLEGAQLVREAAERATGQDAEWLRERARFLAGSESQSARVRAGLEQDLVERMARYPDRVGTAIYDRTLRIMVERERARFGAWYEMFPRSASPEPGRHGTFRDVEARLPYVAEMGFDVLYLPPDPPDRPRLPQGAEQLADPGTERPGQPLGHRRAGGRAQGHPSRARDVRGLRSPGSQGARAGHRDRARYRLSVLARPSLRARPSRSGSGTGPDGTIKYAENPPKKYQDIYPIDFECADASALWAELRDVFLFWIGHGVSIFRVDNPHTKPFKFWDWVIPEVWNRHPDAIFLSEAFTRPKVMRRLAKGGYSQSYTYFTWRNSKWELTEYLTELNRSESAEYMRGNLFANTPDINPEFLQVGGRPAFVIRLVLAATLGATYGIYGPVYEQCVGTPLRPGSEEYLDSEKYQITHWDLDVPWSLRDYIARVNEIRRENPALHYNGNLRFFEIDNDAILCYGKSTPDMTNLIFVVVNLDPYHKQSGWLKLPVHELNLGSSLSESYQVHELISDERFLWHGADELRGARPQGQPRAHPPRPAQDPDRAGFRLFHVKVGARPVRNWGSDDHPERHRSAAHLRGDARSHL